MTAVFTEALALAMSLLSVPPVARVLGQHPLGAQQWLPVLATPLLLLAAEEARKFLVRQRRRPTG